MRSSHSTGAPGIPADQIENTSDGLELSLDKLTIDELVSVHEGMCTIERVICGVMALPRCIVTKVNGRDYNGAGEVFEGIGDRFLAEIERIIEEVKNRAPVDEIERLARNYVLVHNNLHLADDVDATMGAVRPALTPAEAVQ